MILRAENPRQIELMCRADWIADEPLVRVIDEVVSRLDLGELHGRYSEAGRAFYDPAMMLKVWFLGYCDGVRSSRSLEKHLRYDLRFRYFSGSLRPDFHTLSRFRQRNLDLLAGYFAELIRLCEAAGLMDVSIVALDGTKIRASSSSRRTRRGQRADVLRRRLAEELAHDATVEEGLVGDEAVPETGGERAGHEETAASDGGAMGDEPERITDPDARFMKTGEGVLRPCYNAQVIVEQHQLIVAAEVSTAVDDAVEFRGMVEQARQTVEAPLGTVTADGGYYSGQNLKYAHAEGIEVYSPIPKTGRVPDERFARDAFVYDPEGNRYRCPQGVWLSFRKSRTRHGVTSRIYRAPRGACRACAVRQQCTRGAVRTLQISEVAEEEQRMMAKLASREGKRIYDRRKCLVEPVFGNIKFNLGVARFGLRTLAKVRGEFFLVCIAHNLQKLARWGWCFRPARAVAMAEGCVLATMSILAATVSVLGNEFWHVGRRPRVASEI